MGNKRIVPFLHRVLVKPDKIEDVDPTYRAVRAAGLMVAESTRKQEQNAVSVGTVLAVGPTCFLDYHGQPADLKIGDRVIFARYGGKDVPDPENEEENVKLLQDEDILGVIKDD